MDASMLDGTWAIAGGTGLLSAIAGFVASKLNSSVKKTTGEAKAAVCMTDMRAEVDELIAFKRAIEDENEAQKKREHDAALAKVEELELELAERDRKELEDSAQAAQSGIMPRRGG